MKREIIVLANSMRPNGRCIAGICKETKNWIRPIYNAEKEWIDAKDVAHIKLGQIIEINLKGNSPIQDNIQGENWLIDTSVNTNWQCIGAEFLPNIKNLCESEETILHSNTANVDSTIMEKMSLEEKKTLTLIETQVSFASKLESGRVKWRGRFYDKKRNLLDLPVTDPEATKRLNFPNEAKEVNCLLTISLPNTPIKGYCYKLIAGVIWC